MDIEQKIRPYWHVDLKWICGLLFLFVFSATVAIYNFYILTQPDRATEITTLALAAMYSPNGLDDSTDIDKLKADFQKDPNKVIVPFPGLDIKVTKADIDGSSPREQRLRLFRQLAAKITSGEKFQYVGEDGLNHTVNFGAFGLFTPGSHQSLLPILIYASIASLLLLALLVFFSFGVGRLVSPAITLLLISIPGTLFWFLIKTALRKPFPVETLAEGSMTTKLSYMANVALPPITDVVLRNFIYLLAIGLFLVLAAIIAAIILKARRKKRSRMQ